MKYSLEEWIKAVDSAVGHMVAISMMMLLGIGLVAFAHNPKIADMGNTLFIGASAAILTKMKP